MANMKNLKTLKEWQDDICSDIMNEATEHCLEIRETFPVDKYADVMTIKDFTEAADMGSFIPDDGSGYYMTDENTRTNISVWSYDTPPWATHVAWYNR